MNTEEERRSKSIKDRSLASSLSVSSPSDWKMMLVDLRNHGRSTEVEGVNPPHDLVNSAKDLADLVKANGWSWPDVVIEQLWVLDSVPGEVKDEQSDGEVEKVLMTLQS
ncbi:unnamed protein product [Eruca vesicaria subsp. sativa]|uniref:Uncharacterized protein n=1 Tax=Eruca vesicaria subsp. sativa TaxID=29727 RepID=A0ABC8IP89_ERUVS|nr:unnamed protein product [Eruca vesicaria subsp. sativa]